MLFLARQGLKLLPPALRRVPPSRRHPTSMSRCLFPIPVASFAMLKSVRRSCPSLYISNWCSCLVPFAPDSVHVGCIYLVVVLLLVPPACRSSLVISFSWFHIPYPSTSPCSTYLCLHTSNLNTIALTVTLVRHPPSVVSSPYVHAYRGPCTLDSPEDGGYSPSFVLKTSRRFHVLVVPFDIFPA